MLKKLIEDKERKEKEDKENKEKEEKEKIEKELLIQVSFILMRLC
jgi:hypothetical protein